MNGEQFVRRARRYARRNELEYYFDRRHGKGNHGTLYIGGRRTRVQRGEIPLPTLLAMLRQLGIDRREF